MTRPATTLVAVIIVLFASVCEIGPILAGNELSIDTVDPRQDDDLFFERQGRSAVGLTLPALPSHLETRYRTGDGSGRTAIELRRTPAVDEGVVVVEGHDPGRLSAMW